ncbi:MAG TPA: Si-specific NAD(P)(+) transhydrogenase [Myxococcales bacterium]|nr:Si-specific NAD(P)(+) transhydrogenase [Myxococcales bacterium]
MARYDLVVIGSGPAGEKGATQAAYFGKKVALVEKARALGGAAANAGTISSKTLRETALYLSGFRQRGLYGVNMKLDHTVTVRDLLFRERVVKDRERDRVGWNLQRHGVDVVRGEARFVDAHRLAVRAPEGESVLETEHVLIATGSSPARPATFPFESDRVHDSDELVNLEAIPRRMAVVGGGVIGCEYACMFQALGVEVTLVEGRERMLGFLDTEVSDKLVERMQAMGIQLRKPDQVERCDAPAGEPIRLQLKSSGVLEVDQVLVAAGRSGNTASLALEAVGLKPNVRGHLEVNDRFQTAVPTIYAAGDVIGFPALASTSMEQARIAVVHAFDLKYKTSLAPVLPYGIYTIPEVSMAGATEQELQEKKVPYVAGRASFGMNARGQIIGDDSGMLKLLFDREHMKLLGVHVIGETATELVHVGLTALLQGATADLFIQTCFNYPTLSETYKYAAYDALGARAKASPQGP